MLSGHFSGNQKNGFDFYSGHLYLRGFGKLKALALGDFHAQFGQGLTVWSGLAFGKSADVMTSKRNARGRNEKVHGLRRGVGFGKENKTSVLEEGWDFLSLRWRRTRSRHRHSSTLPISRVRRRPRRWPKRGSSACRTRAWRCKRSS